MAAGLFLTLGGNAKYLQGLGRCCGGKQFLRDWKVLIQIGKLRRFRGPANHSQHSAAFHFRLCARTEKSVVLFLSH
jgi:hypothetical protein